MRSWLLNRLNRELVDHPFVLDEKKETIHFSFEKYSIQISALDSYPFSPPRVTIDGKILSYTHTYFPARLINDFSKHNNCPCCVSILCPENWSPSFKILDILKEYVIFVEKLKTRQKLKMFHGVKLPDDMIYEIASFLI